MTEEFVTKAILNWLISNGWKILAFDFPQSGTGRLFHPDDCESEKNKGAINPDIIAVRNGAAVFFENKNRFYYPDFEKVNLLIVDNKYTCAIADILEGENITEIYYGIGLPVSKYSKRAISCSDMVNFVVGVADEGSVSSLSMQASVCFE